MTTAHYVAAVLFVTWMVLFFTTPKKWRGALNAICAIIFMGTITSIVLSNI